MTDFDPEAPLNRIKGESKKAHSAFMTYFQMGTARSLRDLFEKYQKQDGEYKQQKVNERQDNDKQATEKPPTASWWTLGNWSKNNQWQARIAQQTLLDNEIALEQYRQRHMSEAEALAILADHARGDMGQLAGVRAQTDLAKHPHSALVKTITQHYTQTTRGTGEAAQAEIKARIALGLYDAQRALELILKHHGSFEKDNKRQNLNVDVDISNLTVDQLKRLAAGEDIAAILADE